MFSMTRRKANDLHSEGTCSSAREPSPTSMPPLLLASIGNPAPYANTLHSAGHVLLMSLARLLSAPPLLKDRTYQASLISHAADTEHPILLWQSTAYMNDSGPGVAAAWRTFSSQHPHSDPLLVVLHDELELPLGRCSVKRGAGKSARGHNGLKSILAQPMMRQVDFIRVGVGIGPRPTSRDPDVVSKYVLGGINGAEKAKIEKLAEPVWRAIGKEMGGK